MRRRFASGSGRRPSGKLSAMVACMALLWLPLCVRAQAQGPALTTVSGTVYRADGSPAGGVALISWPSFQTADGDAVAAGNQNVRIGSGGVLTAELVPNVGATPAGTYYTVVLQLDDGTARTEYWAVPATSPAAITAVRTTPGTGLANLAATQQYVDAAVANRALDSTVVHLAGTETITGTKQFTVPPSLPAPVGSADAASKGYVDQAVQNVGAGNYVSKAGDTMTGPLVLPGDPAAPAQAADRHYVDNSVAAKADLVSGLVPPAELGTGVASSATCLNGNSTWGSCGGGAPAGITYATTALNWSQTMNVSLTGGTQTTVTLTPCPSGIDTTSGAGYQVQLAGGGNNEAVNVTGGTCASGASSGTITFTPFSSYPAGYTISSASSGIQETINAACGTYPAAFKNTQCNVTIPANGPDNPNSPYGHSINTYNVTGTIYLHSNQSALSGYGTSLNCTGRGACLQLGDLNSANDYTNNSVQGLTFRTPTSFASNPAYAGVQIAQTQRTSQVVTVTTTTAHGFRPGDMVTILFTDNSAFWGDAIVTATPSGTTFQYAHSGADIAAQTTPGVVALAYEAILDNAMNTHFADISYDLGGENGAFNNFFDFWDDENALIEHFNNNAVPLNGNTNWSGSFVFSAGNQGAGHQVAPVITLRDSSITANGSNGVTAYNSNGVYVENTVIQATGPWQVNAANYTGNYQGVAIRNIYSESTICLNPPISGNGPVTCSTATPKSPFPGLGIAGLIAGATALFGNFSVEGSGSMVGGFPTGGSGSTPYIYFIVARDAVTGTQTSPMQVLNYASTGSDTITVRWPRIANGTDGISYDVIRSSFQPAGVGSVYPSAGNCNGGSPAACGYVAHNLSQSTACGNNLVCSYTDSGAAATTAYTVLDGNYTGQVIFWPGSLVSVNKTITVDNEHGNVVSVGLANNPLQAAAACNYSGASSGDGFTACTASTSGVKNQTATLLTDGGPVGGGMTVSKGRLNFSTSPFTNLEPHHIVTLIDSNPGLTRGTWGYRPAASASDTWIGTDVPSGGVALSQGQLAFGAPKYVDFYINNVGDNSSFLERLSATQKLFNVPAVFNNGATVNGSLLVPQGAGYAPPAGGLGLDTTAGLPVVNLGGATHQIPFTTSNISGQAGTALALAATPTQCSGSFATGIAANGNANCTTPNVIQLAETAQPQGIANWGVFWFDLATHTPRVIENNGQVTQLGLTNLFNSDPGGDPADNLEELNGANPQSLRVYSTYTNSTTWQRASLGFDGTDNYAVLRSENATSANAPGLGFWIGGGLKWVVDAAGNLKPWTDNAYNVGSDSGNAAKSVFAKTSFNMYSTGRQDFEFPNDGTTGTTLSALATYNSAGTGAQTAGTSSTDGVIGIVSGGAGMSNKATITWAGLAACTFDAANPGAGNYVVASTTQAGKCHDTGSAARPAGAQVIGRIEGGQVRVSLDPPEGGGGGGAVSSVFGRTGAVVAATGDYSVAQVTGAAADSAVVHLAGAETISGAKTFTSDVTLSGNLNVVGNINQTSASPTQWSGKKWTATLVTVPSGMDYSLGIGSDGALKCQLAGGASCMPANAVMSVFGRTGAVTAASGDYAVSQVTGAAPLASPALTGAPTAPTASTGDNSTKIATTAYVKSETYMSWTCPVAGSTAVSQNCNWTVPAGLTITGLDFAANTAPAGCSTYAVMQLWDGTAGAEVGSYSITLSSGTNFYNQVTGSTNVAAGHLLRMKVTTAASGCSTNAGGMVATVTYQMQN